MMIRFWLILILLFLQAAVLIGGGVAIARRDPQYTCLSFNNITVQLDTSLFVRSTFPLRTFYPYLSSNQQHQVSIEIQTRLAGTKNATLNPFIPVLGYAVVLQSGDQRRVLRHHLPYPSNLLSWSPDSAFLIYSWWGRDNQFWISLTNSVSNDLLTKPLPSYGLNFWDWTADSRYFLLTSYDGKTRYLYVIDSRTRQMDNLIIPDPYTTMNNLVIDSHQFYFTSMTHFYTVDLDHLTYSATSLPTQFNGLLEGVWSPDRHYIYQAGNSNHGYQAQIFEQENGVLRWVAAIPPWSPANTGTPNWSTNSQSLTYFEAAAYGWRTRVFHIPTQQDKIIDENGVRSEIQRGRMLMHSSEGGLNTVKLMDIDGKNAVTIVRTFNYVDIRWQENSTYLSVIEEGQNFIMVHWIGIYEENAHHLQLEENLAIPDDIPVFVRNFLPSSPLSVSGDQTVYSLPNSDQILIRTEERFKTAFYWYDPATQQSVLIEATRTIDDVVDTITLSPDKKYVAFMIRRLDRFSGTFNHFSLYVIQLDHHEHYYLGDFPGWTDRLTWTRCDY